VLESNKACNVIAILALISAAFLETTGVDGSAGVAIILPWFKN
jgi:hypothetical protein